MSTPVPALEVKVETLDNQMKRIETKLDTVVDTVQYQNVKIAKIGEGYDILKNILFVVIGGIALEVVLHLLTLFK